MDGDIEIRAVRDVDMPFLGSIHSYYVLNTVLTFVDKLAPTAQFIKNAQSVAAQGLPFLVAADRTFEPAIAPRGYAYATGFRAGKGAYKHTVEITMFLAPEHYGKGIGSRLLTELLAAMREPVKYPQYYEYARTDKVQPREVKQVIAVMAVDVKGPREGLALKAFYEKFGFELTGHLKKVGKKLNRWVDTMYLQLSLDDPAAQRSPDAGTDKSEPFPGRLDGTFLPAS